MHYRPKDGFIGDMIPFFWEGTYHLFYLPRAPEGRHAWDHIASEDLVHWKELPRALAPGGEDSRDVGCWTGSVIEHEGTFHIFYTGYSPHAEFPQSICHATSKDLVHWEKDPVNPVLLPDARWYEPQDFRDPFVFFNPEAGEFWMLICARDRRVAFERRGCVALATSPDLARWELREPLWSGGVCWAAECPDFFRLGRRWYLVYSHGMTRYRHAESTHGPWHAGMPDSFDGGFVCAAKTLSDGKRQLLFGWVPTREGDRDEGAGQWAGHMAIPRELVPQPDGSLAVKLPDEYAALAAEGAQNPLARSQPMSGTWQVEGASAVAATHEGTAVLKIDAPGDFILSATVVPRGKAAEFGLFVRMQGDRGRKVAIEHGQLALYPWRPWGDPDPLRVRPLALEEGVPVRIHLIVHGSIIEVFAADRVSLAARLYEPVEGWLGLYAANGEVEFRDVAMKALEPLG